MSQVKHVKFITISIFIMRTAFSICREALDYRKFDPNTEPNFHPESTHLIQILI